MASTLKFVVDVKEIRNYISNLDRQAELNAATHFIAARNIQAWFRGIATRNHKRRLDAMAVVIQRHWRGYRGRRVAKKFLIDRVDAMWKNHFAISATVIQAAWRGCRARKNESEVQRMKKWLNFVYEKNELIRSQMRSFQKSQLETARGELNNESLLRILFILSKIQVTSEEQLCPRAIERMIECLKYDHCA